MSDLTGVVGSAERPVWDGTYRQNVERGGREP